MGLAGIEHRGRCPAAGEKAGKHTGSREHGNGHLKSAGSTGREDDLPFSPESQRGGTPGVPSSSRALGTNAGAPAGGSSGPTPAASLASNEPHFPALWWDGLSRPSSPGSQTLPWQTPAGPCPQRVPKARSLKSRLAWLGGKPQGPVPLRGEERRQARKPGAGGLEREIWKISGTPPGWQMSCSSQSAFPRGSGLGGCSLGLRRRPVPFSSPAGQHPHRATWSGEQHSEDTGCPACGTPRPTAWRFGLLPCSARLASRPVWRAPCPGEQHQPPPTCPAHTPPPPLESSAGLLS